MYPHNVTRDPFYDNVAYSARVGENAILIWYIVSDDVPHKENDEHIMCIVVAWLAVNSILCRDRDANRIVSLHCTLYSGMSRSNECGLLIRAYDALLK